MSNEKAVNWKELAKSAGNADVKRLVATFKASVEASPRPLSIEIKVFESLRGTFYAETSHHPVAAPAKPTLGGPGRLAASRPVLLKPGAKEPEPTLALATRTDFQTPEEALGDLLRQVSVMSRRTPRPSWVPNPNY